MRRVNTSLEVPETHRQIIVRLQLVRRCVYQWADRQVQPDSHREDIEELLSGIHDILTVAHEASLCGFMSVCLHVRERVEGLLGQGHLPQDILDLLGEWSVNSELYLRRPHQVEFALAVVKQLNEAAWHAPLGHTEEARLLRSLSGPFPVE
jgi:hypothetical protein